MNFMKFLIVRIRAWRERVVQAFFFYQDLDLLRTSKFTSLGIQINVNDFANITDMDIRSKIVDIKNLIRI